VLIFPLHFLSSILYFITKPLGIESAVSLLITGGFFGLVVVPLIFFSWILYLMEQTISRYYSIEINLLLFIGIPTLICYIVQILILNKDHLSAKTATVIKPQNVMEYYAHKFYDSGLEYNPVRCVPWTVDAKLSPDRQYVFAVHPHGIHCMPLSQFTSYNSEFNKQFPGLVGVKITALCASVMFKLPLVREIFLSWGYVDASRKVANQVLECGKSVVVCTGGEEESMYTTMGKDIVVLRKRKGFIRLALSYGADIVPVFGAGNTDTYRTYSFLSRLRMWLQKNAGIALPIFHGRFFTPLPYKVPINVLIGEPIKTPPPKVIGERPDEALVDEYHKIYITALKNLHSKHVSHRILEIR
jgi:hypothetical protein